MVSHCFAVACRGTLGWAWDGCFSTKWHNRWPALAPKGEASKVQHFVCGMKSGIRRENMLAGTSKAAVPPTLWLALSLPAKFRLPGREREIFKTIIK